MATRVVSASRTQLPNALTVARLALIPVLVVLAVAAEGDRSWGAAGVFALAGITDQVDGWLARRWRVESEFGRYFDPLADRLMIDAAVVLLWFYGRLPWPALVLIVARDAFLLAGYRIVMNRGYDFSVNLLGKAATWVLYASVFALLATEAGADWPLVLFWSGVALALVAGGAYAAGAWRVLRR
jgi:CDP-diacylglycerol--glycerol-3-phosphate 3-phosphatidyltransferase